MKTLRVGCVCVVALVWAVAAVAEWGFTNGAEFPGAKGALDVDDAGVVHLRYDFTGGGAYVGAMKNLEPPLTLKSVSFRVKKPATALLTLRIVDSTDQLLQEPVVFEHDEWQNVDVDMQSFDAHFGGADDGIVHFPVKTVGILLENANLEQPAGEVLLRNIKLNTGGGESQPGELVATYRVADLNPLVAMNRLTLSGTHNLGFESGDTSRPVVSDVALLGNPRSLTVTLRGGRPGNVVKMFLGSHFQTFARALGTLDGGEKQFTVDMPPGNGWEFFGGENDGIVRLPLRINSVVVERGEGPAEPTLVDVVDLTCQAVVSRDEAVSGMARLFSGPDRVASMLTGWNLLDEDQTGTVEVSLRDWNGKEIKHLTEEWTLKAKGEPARWGYSFDLPADRNFAEAVYTFKSPNARFETRACWTRPLDGAGDTTLRPESPWGMGVYLYRYPDPASGSDAMQRAASMAQAAGVKWSREEFSWAHTEPEQGKFDFAFYDSVVNTARSHGISVYGLLSYWSNWTQPYTEKGIDDFCVWAKAVVGHFKDRVKHWEVYNEPNIFFWQGPKELYPLLVKKCYAAIKEADPEAQVLACSTAGIDLKFIDLCVKAGAPFDILTVHPYRGYLSERSLARDLRQAGEHVGGRPVWITEMGWSTFIGGKDERAQAGLLARSYLTAVASGVCPNISWYDFRDDGNDPFYNESNFGILRNDFTPKPGYRALATVCRSLESGAPRLREDLGEGIYALEMGEATAVWSPLKNLRLPCRIEGEAKILNLMGEAQTVENGLELLRGQPLFVVGGKVVPTAAPEPIQGFATEETGTIQF